MRTRLLSYLRIILTFAIFRWMKLTVEISEFGSLGLTSAVCLVRREPALLFALSLVRSNKARTRRNPRETRHIPRQAATPFLNAFLARLIYTTQPTSEFPRCMCSNFAKLSVPVRPSVGTEYCNCSIDLNSRTRAPGARRISCRTNQHFPVQEFLITEQIPGASSSQSLTRSSMVE